MFWIKRLNKGAFRMAALSALLPSVESAANGGFEPRLTDAAPRSNGGNVGQTGCTVSVRYAYC
jgi:hypothetical protein